MDSSAFFQYPSGTLSGDSGSASTPWFLGDLREDQVPDVLSYTRARQYGRGRLAIRRGTLIMACT